MADPLFPHHSVFSHLAEVMFKKGLGVIYTLSFIHIDLVESGTVCSGSETK